MAAICQQGEVSTYDNEHTEKAEKWLNEMKLASVKPDKTVYVEMMTAFAKAGDYYNNKSTTII